jgi:hypothetical protein
MGMLRLRRRVCVLSRCGVVVVSPVSLRWPMQIARRARLLLLSLLLKLLLGLLLVRCGRRSSMRVVAGG